MLAPYWNSVGVLLILQDLLDPSGIIFFLNPIFTSAKLNSVVGVMEALAPSVYMPTSSYIYVNTIESFPGAFYMFDAALTVLALVLFL